MQLLLDHTSLDKKADKLWNKLHSCDLCPFDCGVDRLEGEKGVCRADGTLYISSYNLHYGEEPPISGVNGSGTIFFTHCLSRCVYCQNYPISQMGYGNKRTVEELSGIMLYLQKRGAHNINLVTPTHYVAHIVKALVMAKKTGLNIPVVYNTFGYEKVDVLKMLEGFVDIYLVDMRYSSDDMALKYSRIRNYVEINRRAVKEMFRQVGNLVVENGIAKRGIIIRLLVMPENISGTKDTLRFIADNISKDVYISLMSQYFPAYKAYKYPPLDRGLTYEEYDEIVKEMNRLGFNNGWIQEMV